MITKIASAEAELAEILSDEDVVRVHGNADFGGPTPREVVNSGVRKYAVGYQGGHTQLSILREHGLITKPKGYAANLTAKGKRYARALAHLSSLRDALVLAALEAAEDGHRRGLIDLTADEIGNITTLRRAALKQLRGGEA